MQEMPPIQTIWRTAYEQCELVWIRFAGCHLRLWVENRLVIDELVTDVESALKRAWELKVDSPRVVE